MESKVLEYEMTSAEKVLPCFLLSLVIVLLTLYYQRVTGPTYERTVVTNLNGKTYQFNLPRSHSIDSECRFTLTIPDTSVSGRVYYKRHPTGEVYVMKEFNREGNSLVTTLPNQPPAGKLKYFLEFSTNDREITVLKAHPIIIRFKGAVPVIILIPHIIFMFVGMWLSNFAGLLALRKMAGFKFYGNLTLLLLGIGGLLLGPTVQYNAFGEWWAGIPFGWDLTDNKLLISFLVWLTAVLGNRKKERPYLAVIAALLVIIVYAIPHSMLGSEFDYNSGEVVTGN